MRHLTRRDALRGVTLGAGATLLNPILAQVVAGAEGATRRGQEAAAVRVRDGRQTAASRIRCSRPPSSARKTRAATTRKRSWTTRS